MIMWTDLYLIIRHNTYRTICIKAFDMLRTFISRDMSVHIPHITPVTFIHFITNNCPKNSCVTISTSVGIFLVDWVIYVALSQQLLRCYGSYCVAMVALVTIDGGFVWR